jgi:hypothetical protein
MKLTSRKALLVGIGFSCVASLSALAGVTTITFDELGSQPSLFDETVALGNQYSYLGVDFMGNGSPSGGGAILDQSGNFGVPALSGNDFLAFNANARLQNGGIPSGPEIITFASPVSSVSIYGGFGSSVDFTLAGYGASDNLLASTSAENAPGQYVELSIAAPGITSITLNGDSYAYVFDNLSFGGSGGNSVPDAGSTFVCLGIGLIGLVGLRRRMFAGQCQ